MLEIRRKKKKEKRKQKARFVWTKILFLKGEGGKKKETIATIQIYVIANKKERVARATGEKKSVNDNTYPS